MAQEASAGRISSAVKDVSSLAIDGRQARSTIRGTIGAIVEKFSADAYTNNGAALYDAASRTAAGNPRLSVLDRTARGQLLTSGEAQGAIKGALRNAFERGGETAQQAAQYSLGVLGVSASGLRTGANNVPTSSKRSIEMQDPMFVPPLRDVGKDLPCWPNQSSLSVFMTRGLSVWLGQYAFYSVIVIFGLIFLFGRQLDEFLRWVGYDSQFVSHFFFLRDQYSHWVGDKRYDQIGVEPFRLLEITIWLSLALWGTRFLAGILFLKQYDKLYLEMDRNIDAKAKMYIALIFAVFGLFVVVELQDFVESGAVLFAFKQSPKLFFYVISLTYCGLIGMVAKPALFFAWKKFRKNRPGVVLWRDELAAEARQLRRTTSTG